MRIDIDVSVSGLREPFEQLRLGTWLQKFMQVGQDLDFGAGAGDLLALVRGDDFDFPRGDHRGCGSDEIWHGRQGLRVHLADIVFAGRGDGERQRRQAHCGCGRVGGLHGCHEVVINGFLELLIEGLRGEDDRLPCAIDDAIRFDL